MRIHWYWPFGHAGPEATYVLHTVRSEDSVTVQSLRTRFGRESTATGSYEIVRDLAETNAQAPPAIPGGRAAHRAGIYVQRARARHRLVSSDKFDVTCQHHLNHYVDALALRRLAPHAAIVSFVHDVVPHEPRLPTRLERALLRSTYETAGQLVVYHETLRHELVADFGVQPDRVHVIPHPLVQHSTAPPVDDGSPCRFLFFGTFRSNKGIDILIHAARQLQDIPGWELHLAGRASGAIAERVMRLANECDNVTCEIGFISGERKHHLFVNHDVIVLPYTRFASQSGVLADAYGHARGLIVSDVGALGATVREDCAGAVVEPGSIPSLVEAMRSASRRPDLRVAWGTTAAAAAALHSFDAVGSQLRHVFDIAHHSSGRGGASAHNHL